MTETTRRTPPVGAERGVAGAIEDYFDLLVQVFARARSRTQPQTATWRLAGRTVRCHLAGDGLAAVLWPALAQLESGVPEAAADLEIFAWETAATGERLPPPPWAGPADDAPHRLAFPAGAEHFHLMAEPDSKSLLLYRADRRQAFLWVEAARDLTTHWYGSPLRRLFHWWGLGEGLYLIHAGCIGTEAGAVLLAGRGGSGKSTTSLLGLEAGMRYLGDDSCLLHPGPPAIVHSLYNTGRLHGDHLRRFPHLAGRTVEPRPQDGEKPIFFAQQHFPAAIARQLPLRAVVLPQVTGRPETRAVRIPAADALRGLAPSTLFQMPAREPERFRAMGRLVREVACFRLELGTRFPEIAPTLAQLIADLA